MRGCGGERLAKVKGAPNQTSGGYGARVGHGIGESSTVQETGIMLNQRQRFLTKEELVQRTWGRIRSKRAKGRAQGYAKAIKIGESREALNRKSGYAERRDAKDGGIHSKSKTGGEISHSPQKKA